MGRIKKFKQSAIYIKKNIRDIMKNVNNFPITFISAPAGYGKTTLVDYFCGNDIPRIILEQGDRTFLFNKLADCFGRYWPGFAEAVRMLCNPDSNRNALKERIDTELSEVRFTSSSMIIVIENFHFTGQDKIIADMIYKIAAASGGNIRFIITSRINYWNRNSYEVLRGKISIITPEMLVMDENDIANYFKACGINADKRAAEYALKETGGWINALYLMVVSYINTGKLEIKADFTEYVKNITDGFITEDEALDVALLCLLEDFTKVQASDYTGKRSTEKLIDYLSYNNIFIMYNNERDSYSFNRVFRRFMKKKLMESMHEECMEYLKKAGDLFYKDGDFVTAALYYYKCEDYECMMESVESGKNVGRNEEIMENYVNYYHACPREIRSRYHLAVLYMAWRFFNFGKHKMYEEASLEFLEDINSDVALSQDKKNSLLCDYSIFKAMTDYYDLDKVKQDYENAAAVYDGNVRNEHSVIPRTFGSMSVMMLFYNRGSIDDMLVRMHEIERLGSELTGGGWTAMSAQAEAEAAFVRLDLKQADIMLHRTERESSADPLRFAGVRLCSIILGAHKAVMEGDYETLHKSLSRLNAFMRDERIGSMKYSAEAASSGIYAMLGIPEMSESWLKTGNFSDVTILYPAMPSIYVVYLNLLFVMKKYSKILSYEDLFFGKNPYTENIIVRQAVCMVMAAAWNEIGKTYNVGKWLEEAFHIGLQNGSYLPIVLYAENLIPYMRQLPAEYKKMTEEIIRHTEVYVRNREYVKARIEGRKMYGLTVRESQVASCVSAGMINREIAEELSISENTVKTTLQRIFSKLDVSSRRELALKIQQYESLD